MFKNWLHPGKNQLKQVNYPEFPHLLSDEIKRRQKEKELFYEGQLYYLLYALTAVKIDAKQRGGVVGDIKP